MLKHLLPARLADVNHRSPVQVLRADLLLRLPRQPASPAAPPPQPAAPAAGPSRSGGREPPSARCPVASGSPAAADLSRRTAVAACNSAPTLSIAPEPGAWLETISG